MTSKKQVLEKGSCIAQRAIHVVTAFLAVACLVASLPGTAQVMPRVGDISPANQTPDIPQTMQGALRMAPAANMQLPTQESNVDRRTGTYGPVGQPGQASMLQVPPFGADLFTGGFRGPRGAGLNPNYHIRPGDRVVLRIWGAVNFNSVLPVDVQGNIFIPNIGPVHVAGVAKGSLKSRIEHAIHQVFTDNVSVYTNLQGVQPVAVFVTGYVQKPGRYAGTPSASVLYFIDQASGIQQQSGSYRHIRITRNGKTIARVDLYDFLINGTLPDVRFQDGDTIVVGERGPVITVLGDVAQPYRYELADSTRSGAALQELAQLKPGVTHVLITGVRGSDPYSVYLPLPQFRQAELHAGDMVYFSSDQHAETMVVQVEGSFEGPSRYVVPEDTTLHQLLNNIPVDPEMAAVNDIFIRRDKVAKRQREALEASLRRLETTYLGASSQTVDEARIRVQEAELIQDFVKRASQVEPSGVLVVAQRGQIRNIRLQPGDEIVIPETSNSVLITGEVLVPRAMIYTKGMDAEDYIRRAGGFTTRANEDRILIVRNSGEVLPASSVDLEPGDKIMVLPEAPSKNLELASTLARIVFQIAVATRTVLNL